MFFKTYEKVENFLIWVLLITGVLFFGWFLWATEAPEAGFLYDFPFFRSLGVLSGWVFLVTAVTYWTLNRLHNRR